MHTTEKTTTDVCVFGMCVVRRINGWNIVYSFVIQIEVSFFFYSVRRNSFFFLFFKSVQTTPTRGYFKTRSDIYAVCIFAFYTAFVIVVFTGQRHPLNYHVAFATYTHIILVQFFFSVYIFGCLENLLILESFELSVYAALAKQILDDYNRKKTYNSVNLNGSWNGDYQSSSSCFIFFFFCPILENFDKISTCIYKKRLKDIYTRTCDKYKSTKLKLNLGLKYPRKDKR